VEGRLSTSQDMVGGIRVGGGMRLCGYRRGIGVSGRMRSRTI
jgi:hypothetical protein